MESLCQQKIDTKEKLWPEEVDYENNVSLMSRVNQTNSENSFHFYIFNSVDDMDGDLPNKAHKAKNEF